MSGVEVKRLFKEHWKFYAKRSVNNDAIKSTAAISELMGTANEGDTYILQRFL